MSGGQGRRARGWDLASAPGRDEGVVETNTLEVEFASGGVHDDEGVPPEEALQLLQAESLGHYLAEHIRGPYHASRSSRAA